MSLAWRQPSGSGDERKAWALAWPISLGIHLLGLFVLYLIFLPGSDPLAESSTIHEVHFAEPDPVLQDRPTLRSASAPALSDLLQSPAEQPLPSMNPGDQLTETLSVIGLNSGENAVGTRAIFSTSSRLSPPQVSFFGSTAAGYRIVFVVDRSGSMWDQFGKVRDELLNALGRLGPNQQFQVIFFSSGKPQQMLPIGFRAASPVNKKKAYDFLQRIGRMDPVSGPTDPGPALLAGLSLPNGPADAIFLLSDGDFRPEVLDSVSQANPKTRTRIYTLGFGYRAGGELLQKLARSNGGSFRFVEISKFSGQDSSSLDALLR